ncbi:MAG: hypothetical protein J6Y90_03115, partial [Lachnospiraceae bacterium]|nr:hypothetical protein [Lachnospiraceae bacterium]
MVNKLRKKFVITAMLSLLVILVIMIAVINIANVSQSVRDADNLLQLLTTNNGFFPGMMGDDNMQPPKPERPYGFRNLNNMRTREMPYQSRYFWVRFDSSGNILETDVTHIASVTEDTAKEAATEVYSRGKDKGFYRSFRYKLGNNADGTKILVFSDLSTSLVNVYRLLLQSLLIGLFTLIAMFILVFLFSGRAVAPAVESMEKQKRFITDAGHEL